MKLILRVTFLCLVLFSVGGGVSFLKNQIKTRPYINLSKIKERVEKFYEIGEKTVLLVEKKDIFVDKRKKVENKGRFMDKVGKKMNRPNDYSRPSKKRESLKWKTIHFEETHFDNPEERYVKNIELSIQFEKINHRRLFKNYLAALSELRDTEELSKNLIAQKGTRREKAHTQVTPPQKKLAEVKQVNRVLVSQLKVNKQNGPEVVVEDQVHQKMAKSKVVAEKEKTITFDYPSDEKKGKESYNPFLPGTYNGTGVLPEAAVLAAVKRKKTHRVAQKATQMGHSRAKSHQEEVNSQSIVNVRAQVFSFREGPSGEHQHFEIRPDYSGQERWSDQGLGQVSIQTELNSGMGVMGVFLYGRGIMDTRMDLVLERGVVTEVSVPVFLRDEFEGLQSRQKSLGAGGNLFIELDDSTESVALDKEYEMAIYLNKKLQQVGKDDDYHYILFLGIAPGATTLEYIRNGYEDLRKVVLVEEGTIYYDLNRYLEMGKDIVQIKQRNMLGHRQSDLNIKGQKITQFNSYEKVSQIGPSQYDLTTNMILAGTRKYVELGHMSSSLYLGRWDAKEVVIPSEDYIAYFLKVMGLEDLSGSCLVQVNFSNKVEELYVEGKNGGDYIPVDQIYLDEEGEFSDSLSPFSVQGFFLSDKTGVFSFKVKYKNGKQDYLNSYCSSSTYIIEQL